MAEDYDHFAVGSSAGLPIATATASARQPFRHISVGIS
jgi:hypothetical protein